MGSERSETLTERAKTMLRRTKRQDHFQKFTARARTAVTLAQDEARRYDHDYVGTEHLLLGLLREGQGVAARALAALEVDLDRARGALERVIGRGTPGPTSASCLGLTPRAKAVFERADEEARCLRHRYIGTEHLLLGLLAEADGEAARALGAAGVTLEGTRGAIEETIGCGQVKPSGHVRFTPRAKHVLELSLRKAQELGHDQISTEHILLGVLAEVDGVAVQVITGAGVSVDRLRADVLARAGQ